MVIPKRVNPALRMFRWYSVAVQGTLFDQWAVICFPRHLRPGQVWGSLRTAYSRQRAIPASNREDAERMRADG